MSHLSPKRQSKPSILLSQAGVSLMNVIVAMGMGAMVTVGIMVIMSNTQKQQRIVELSSTLENISQQVQNALSREGTWVDTINANANLQCIKLGTDCNPGYVATSYNMSLPAISIVSGGQTILNEGSMAFSISGTQCKDIPTSLKSDECPIRYRVRFFLDKVSSKTGLTVTIVAKLIFWPNDNSIYKGRYSNYDPNSLTVQKYDVIMSRKFSHQVDTTVPTCEQDGIVMYPGQSRNFFKTKHVAIGEFCESELRSCELINGTAFLNGTYPETSCVQNCHGEWGDCICDGNGPRPSRQGVRIYQLLVPNNEWGRMTCNQQGEVRSCTTQDMCL